MPGVASSEVVLRAKGSERPYKETKSLVTSGMVSAYIQVIIKCLFYTHMHPFNNWSKYTLMNCNLALSPGLLL